MSGPDGVYRICGLPANFEGTLQAILKQSGGRRLPASLHAFFGERVDLKALRRLPALLGQALVVEAAPWWRPARLSPARLGALAPLFTPPSRLLRVASPTLVLRAMRRRAAG